VELKSANPDPKISQTGSGSADLDRGVVDDDDDDDANGEAGMNGSLNVGTFQSCLRTSDPAQD
jgi:hypothetical protein